MKMNIPCRVLKMVKRYAITMEESLRKNRPKDQVSPIRQRRTKAPDTHDLGKNKPVVNGCRGRRLNTSKTLKCFSVSVAASRNTRGKRDNVAVASDDDGGRSLGGEGRKRNGERVCHQSARGGDGEYG